MYVKHTKTLPTNYGVPRGSTADPSHHGGEEGGGGADDGSDVVKVVSGGGGSLTHRKQGLHKRWGRIAPMRTTNTIVALTVPPHTVFCSRHRDMATLSEKRGKVSTSRLDREDILDELT